MNVFDGRGGTDSAPVSITVRGANRPPRFDSTAPAEATAGKALAYTPLTSDPDGDVVTVYSGPQNPDRG
jgi:hypothetical protein